MVLASAPANAQPGTAVAGLVINPGIVPAEVALTADGHRDSHPANPPSGSQGEHSIRVIITPRQGAAAVVARFEVHHAIRSFGCPCAPLTRFLEL